MSHLSLGPHEATCFGVFRNFERPVYGEAMHAQLQSVRERMGAGDLENMAVWEQLPGFFWHAPVLRAKVGAETIAVHQSAPVVRRVDPRRVPVIGRSQQPERARREGAGDHAPRFSPDHAETSAARRVGRAYRRRIDDLWPQHAGNIVTR